ncbi:MAG: hypothetical protein WCH99_12130 [Verrucomicrobiota bacterium]
MLRAPIFIATFVGLMGALPAPTAAAPGFGLQYRPDWRGDPYLVTNPPNTVALVLNAELFDSNTSYQEKVNALAATVEAAPGDAFAGVTAMAKAASLTRKSATQFLPQPMRNAVGLGKSMEPSDHAVAAPTGKPQTTALSSETPSLRLALILQRWLLFTLVVFFLARRVWRYFRDVEEDDDFANHLTTLARAHHWIFPVYMALLATVAAAEFLQIGNLFFSLSVLLLASAVRGYYCEGDFVDFPTAKKIHLAMSLALIWLGWTQGFDNYLSDFSAWQHGHIRIWIMLMLLIQIYRGAVNSPDLAEQQTMLKALRWSFLATGMVGGIVGCVVWIKMGFTGGAWLGFFEGGAMACVSLFALLFATKNPVLSQVIGGTILDTFMPRFFGQKILKKKHLPSVLLLRHWREHGEVEKAWQTAQSHLFKEARALAVWMFAMETSVLYRRQPAEALNILKKLCAAEDFHYDHRRVAVAQVQGWMAAAGFPFDPAPFKIERPPLNPSALTDRVEAKCRAGRFGEAVAILTEVLQKDSLNEAAFTQLVRIYCQDLKNRPAAEKLIAEAGETFSPKMLDFLSTSLDEWIKLPIRSAVRRRSLLDRLLRKNKPETSQRKIILSLNPRPAPPKAQDPLEVHLERLKQSQAKNQPDTTGVLDRVEKLILERRLGTAVELLKEQAEAEPANFDLWLRYAEAHGNHCGQVATAEKIIIRMERSGNFKKAQIKKAYTRLKKWQKKHPLQHTGW